MRQPSLMAATAALSVTALFFSLGGAGWAANGAAFVLGVLNSATARTLLGVNYNGTALQLSNNSAGAAATALTLSVAVGHPPMKVNSVTKVANLNSDYLDGLDSTALARVMRVPFNLAPGASSPSITLPPNSQGELVAAVTIAPDHVGSGIDNGMAQLSFVHVQNQYLMWEGFEWASSSAHIASVGSGPATHMAYIDRNNKIELVVDSANSIKVVNTGAEQIGGATTIFW